MKILSDGLPEKGLMRPAQLLSALPISRSHFYALVKQRGVPAHPISPHVVTYDVADIRRLILHLGSDPRPT
jgi:predicted DNA-binding transcriptional regulator AlpA